MTDNNLQNYLGYLSFLDEKFQRFFKSQKPFIFCKKGCGECCKNAVFPYTKIELRYLLLGIMRLPIDIQNKIQNNLANILEKRKKYYSKYKNKYSKDELRKKFKYDCPMLIDNVCSVYEYRGILCRAFGLLTNNSKGGKDVPFCCFDGKNYSNIINKRTKKISPRKIKKLCVEEEPCSFNIDYDFLIHPDFANGFHFEFGEKKALIEWFENFKL
ncbi:MAG: hypothetical protein MJ237_01985 [bacterium]|nr:hypothetical protein [bacterium]